MNSEDGVFGNLLMGSSATARDDYRLDSGEVVLYLGLNEYLPLTTTFFPEKRVNLLEMLMYEFGCCYLNIFLVITLL